MSDQSQRRIRMHALAIATVAALSSSLAVPAFAQARVNLAGLEDQSTHDRFIVKYRDGSAPRDAGALNRSLTAAAAATPHGKALGLRQLRRMSSGAEVLTTGKKLGRQDAEALMRKLAADPNVEYVEVDAKRYPMAQTRPYGIDLVQAPQVWADGVTGDGITVCVIDSGIHAAHEDFQGVNLVGGYPADWNTDYCGHGSHVSGTIAGADNGTGVVGVNTGNISLYTVKVFGSGTSGSCAWSYSSDLVDAANRCGQAGAKVINMSLGGPVSTTSERNAFDNLNANGVLSIAAAGNDGNTEYSYPASYDSVVSVGGVDVNKAHYTDSQRNDQVELAAPGVSVLSTVPQVSATTAVDGVSYIVAGLEFTHQGTVNAALVDGGRCASAGSWTGKVVLCERGDIAFSEKVNNVIAGGGIAAIIYNNAPGGFGGTLGETRPGVPVLSMTQEDGQYLVANKLGVNAAVSTVPNNQANGYAFNTGTSMATPHVAGVAALLWSANPSWTNQEIREALAATAEDIGAPGRDNSFGWGLIQAKAALDELNNGGGGDPPPPGDGELQNGVPVAGIGGGAGSEQRWTLTVPTGASDLKFVTSGGSGDADLYVKFGSAPTTSSYDCRPYTSGNNETCSFATPQAGTYHVLVRGYSAYSGMSLTGSYSAGGGSQTYASATRVDIRDNATVESPIAVSGRSGNAPNNAVVDVDIRHTYKGDLKVDLVAPDGSVYNLHNRTGGSADNVIGTYTLNLSSEVLNGTWKLRVNDNANQDTGYISGWAITF